MSWIALDDLLGVLLQAIADDRLAGPVNAVAPHAVSNGAFAATLGRVLGRPAVLRTPATALRLAAGELADELLLASQMARPARLEEVGFSFAFPTLEDALRHELGRFGGSRGAKVSAALSHTAVQPSQRL
jgi:NAD dependent epimerase/dehydratase family enzyme